MTGPDAILTSPDAMTNYPRECSQADTTDVKMYENLPYNSLPDPKSPRKRVKSDLEAKQKMEDWIEEQMKKCVPIQAQVTKPRNTKKNYYVKQIELLKTKNKETLSEITRNKLQREADLPWKGEDKLDLMKTLIKGISEDARDFLIRCQHFARLMEKCNCAQAEASINDWTRLLFLTGLQGGNF